jgi:lipopolysaccharide export system permease protein
MVVFIYLVVDFLEKIDDFLESDLPLTLIISFFVYKIPFIVAQITPVGLLLAILIAYGLMSKNNEIIALKSNGVSIYNLIKPALAIGCILSILLFFLSEIFVPITMNKANNIWIREIKKQPAVTSMEKNIWIKGDHLITHIKYYQPHNDTIFGITQNYFNDAFQLVRRIDAAKGTYTGDQWVLMDVIDQNLKKSDESYEIAFHDEWVGRIDFLPEDLEGMVKKSEEMNFIEMLDYIRKIEAEGYDASTYRVDLHAKTAFPLVCILMCFIGTGIAVRGKSKEGLPVSISYGLGIAFLFWVIYSFCLSLGYGGMLPPVIAAWASNFIFLCLGGILMLNAE